MGKPTICIGQNKSADQLRGNPEADQHRQFHNTQSRIHLLLKSKLSSFQPFSVTIKPALCQTRSEPQIVCFLMHRLILDVIAYSSAYSQFHEKFT